MCTNWVRTRQSWVPGIIITAFIVLWRHNLKYYFALIVPSKPWRLKICWVFSKLNVLSRINLRLKSYVFLIICYQNILGHFDKTIWHRFRLISFIWANVNMWFPFHWLVDGQYGKLDRYSRTLSSTKWVNRSINSTFDQFIQVSMGDICISPIETWTNRWEIEFIDLFVHLGEYEVLKYLPSFPKWVDANCQWLWVAE